jgi:hypothetical protein
VRVPICGAAAAEEEERGLIKDLKRHGQLAVAWDRVCVWKGCVCGKAAADVSPIFGENDRKKE